MNSRTLLSRRAGIPRSSDRGRSRTPSSGKRRLEEYQNPGSLISLDYSNRGTAFLPNIKQFKNLTEIDLSGNLLKTQVAELSLLKYLKKVNLSRNDIDCLWALPTTLEVLVISKNRLKALGSNVSRLKKLRYLDMAHNQIENLEPIVELTSLRYLKAKDNKIESLQGIEGPSLVEIDLENNRIQKVAELKNFCTSTSITYVNLRNNPVQRSQAFWSCCEHFLPHFEQLEEGILTNDAHRSSGRSHYDSDSDSGRGDATLRSFEGTGSSQFHTSGMLSTSREFGQKSLRQNKGEICMKESELREALRASQSAYKEEIENKESLAKELETTKRDLKTQQSDREGLEEELLRTKDKLAKIHSQTSESLEATHRSLQYSNEELERLKEENMKLQKSLNHCTNLKEKYEKDRTQLNSKSEQLQNEVLYLVDHLSDLCEYFDIASYKPVYKNGGDYDNIELFHKHTYYNFDDVVREKIVAKAMSVIKKKSMKMGDGLEFEPIKPTLVFDLDEGSQMAQEDRRSYIMSLERQIVDLKNMNKELRQEIDFFRESKKAFNPFNLSGGCSSISSSGQSSHRRNLSNQSTDRAPRPDSCGNASARKSSSQDEEYLKLKKEFSRYRKQSCKIMDKMKEELTYYRAQQASSEEEERETHNCCFKREQEEILQRYEQLVQHNNDLKSELQENTKQFVEKLRELELDNKTLERKLTDLSARSTNGKENLPPSGASGNRSLSFMFSTMGGNEGSILNSSYNGSMLSTDNFSINLDGYDKTSTSFLSGSRKMGDSDRPSKVSVNRKVAAYIQKLKAKLEKMQTKADTYKKDREELKQKLRRSRDIILDLKNSICQVAS